MTVEPGNGQQPDPAQVGAQLHFLVSAQDTASALGSGDVEVLATPRLLAWAEAATVAALAAHLPAGRTSVGVRVELEHLRATPVGASVVVRATWVPPLERVVVLTVQAEHRVDQQCQPVLVARGEVHRAVVDRQRFVAGLPVPSKGS